MRLPRVPRLLLPLIGLGCHDLFDGVFPYVCEARDESALERLPRTLADTGLYADAGSEILTLGVLTYRPAFELWSDGATKRRWLWLPPGTSIDTSDPDAWVFPTGTKAWKEFSRDEARIETRLIAKVGPPGEEWLAQSYVWDEEGNATAAPMGYIDARGTEHDVPAALECAGCHAGRRSFLLGVSALQLAGPAAIEELDLTRLAEEERLSQPLPQIPSLPGDEDARAALGYLHTNCGHCHNRDAPAERPCFDADNGYDFWLRLDRLGSMRDTPTYTSTVGDAIRPGDAGGSPVVQHMSTRDLFARMPPLGARELDPAGIALVRRWIDGLQ